MSYYTVVIYIKTISLCMIVKDEEKVLDKCLSSIVDIVDEIIIVDTGSKDKTIEISKKYTHKIYNFKWIGDFSKARNYSLSKATCDYILWLDADDYLDEDSIDKLTNLKKSLNDKIDMYYFLYEFNKEYEPFYRERLFKNNGKYNFVGKIHEAIKPIGALSYENIIIKQQEKEIVDVSRNLRIYQKMDKSEFSERDYYYYGKELYRNKKYKKAIVYLKKFLSFKNIYNEDAIDACYTLYLIYIITSNNINTIEYLFKSFYYDLPRANILCELGNFYLNNNEVDKAIYYFNLALTCNNNKKGFVLKDYFGYIPLLQLCVCYDKLAMYEKAYECNELANKIKNNEMIYEHNKKYLKSKLK